MQIPPANLLRPHISSVATKHYNRALICKVTTWVGCVDRSRVCTEPTQRPYMQANFCPLRSVNMSACRRPSLISEASGLYGYSATRLSPHNLKRVPTPLPHAGQFSSLVPARLWSRRQNRSGCLVDTHTGSESPRLHGDAFKMIRKSLIGAKLWCRLSGCTARGQSAFCVSSSHLSASGSIESIFEVLFTFSRGNALSFSVTRLSRMVGLLNFYEMQCQRN